MFRALAILFLVVSLPATIAGLVFFRSNMEDVFQWLPDSSSDRRLYDDFVAEFGSDDFVVVSWPGLTADDSRGERFATRLAASDEFGFVQLVVSGSQLLRELEDQAGLAPELIRRRFRGIYFGPDGTQTAVMINLTPFGMSHRKEVMTLIRNVVAEVLEQDAHLAAYAGKPVVGALGDELVRRSLFEMVGPSCLAAAVAAWLCMRCLRLTIVLLGSSGLAAGVSIAFITLTGGTWGGLTTVIPALAFLMCGSGGLHLMNYARTCPGITPAEEVLAVGWKPCVYSAVTTAIGLLSLGQSQYPAIRMFGYHGAAGVAAALVCQLLLVPNLISWVRPALSAVPPGHWQRTLFDGVVSARRELFASFLLLGAVFALGLPRLTANLELERVFHPRTEVMRNIAWLEKTIGPVEQTELIVDFLDPRPDGMIQRLRLVRNIQARILSETDIHGALSLANFLPDEPSGVGVRNIVARGLFRNAVVRIRDTLDAGQYIHVSPNRESWRISLRVPFLDSTDYAGLAAQVHHSASEVLSESGNDPSVSLRYTGVSHLYQVAQSGVVSDLYRNFGLAFVVICPLMMLAVRSFSLGLLAMIPNVLPTVIVFGGIGLAGYPLDLSIAMTASVALGIAVDDTTHFLVRFQELAGRDRHSFPAFRQAFVECSRAMMATTVIAGTGLSMFLGGDLLAMTRFAGSLIALLTVALLCDLVQLPSLLVTCNYVRKLDKEVAGRDSWLDSSRSE